MLRSGARTKRPARRAGACQHRAFRSLAPLVLALLTLSCFEQPVTESLEIRFLPGRAAMIRVVVKLADPDQFRDSPLARERIESARREILDARDPWTRRLMSLEPVSERKTLDRQEGELILSDHRVIVEDAGILKRFFSDTLLVASVTFGKTETEFALTPGPGSRASRQQREAFQREMNRWASSVARYMETGERLYAYLALNPDRAGACFGSVFADALSDEARTKLETLSATDAAWVEPFEGAMEETLHLFAVPPDSALSPEELSRIVHDPFPASLLVRVPGPVLEVEGFQDQGLGVLRVPSMGLWGAFTRIRNRWLSPDPLVTYYEHLSGGRKPLDLEEFLRLPRSARPAPSADVLLGALEEQLRPAAAYRVRWSAENLPEMEHDEGPIWDNPALR